MSYGWAMSVSCGAGTGDAGCLEPGYSVGSAIVLGIIIVLFVGGAVLLHRANKGRKRKDGGEL